MPEPRGSDVRVSQGRGLTTEGIVDRIERASSLVRRDLVLVGARAKYIWPGAKHSAWGGYSYELPKEEQIRSAFWAHLHDREALVCELEWGLFERASSGVRAGREIDLVGFAAVGEPAPPVLLLEFKRVWSLDSRTYSCWNNKATEMRSGIENDLRKLEDARKAILSCAQSPLVAGVIVVGFADSTATLDELKEQVRPREAALAQYDLWSGAEVLCQAELDRGEVRTIHSRADLFVLEG